MSVQTARRSAVRVAPGAGALQRLLRGKVTDILVLAALLIAWEAAVRLGEIPRWFLPAPSEIALALWRGFAIGIESRGGYIVHIRQTVYETFVGFCLGSSLGILLGMLISQFKVARRLLLPYILAFQSLPKVAVAPLFLIWFGIGDESKLAVVILITFFPVLVNSIAGFSSVEQSRIDLLRSLAATRSQIFRKVVFPSALPFIFAGLEMAAVFSLVGALVGEFMGGTAGLGILLIQRQVALDTAGVFAVFCILSLLGIVLTSIVQFARDRLLFWAPSSKRARTRTVRGPISA
ncbi:MAG: ABC transporter permease [Chloroflexi bacterium]|nr:ABC transporter permease [Chloroflexota bacterium]